MCAVNSLASTTIGLLPLISVAPSWTFRLSLDEQRRRSLIQAEHMPIAPLELAERAHALVQAKPFQAHALAEQALALAEAQRDGEARVAAPPPPRLPRPHP